MQGNSWVVWYTFELYYNPVQDLSIIDEELAAMIEEVDNYLTENGSSMSSVANNATQDLLDKARNTKASGTTEEKSKAVTDLKEALEDAKENVVAYEAYNIAYDNLTIAMSDYQDTASPEALEAANTLASDADADALTTEGLIAGADAFNKAAARLKLPDYSQTPCDFTQMIENNSFENGDLTGWDAYIGGDTGAKESGEEGTTYYVSNVDGIYVFNTWSSSAPAGGFYVSQKLYCLPAGTYTLQALLASDAGTVITLSANSTSQEFTMENDKTIATDGSLSFSLSEETDVEIKASSPNWFKADNFRLTYESSETLKKGDVNEDGDIDISDIVAIINQIAGKNTYKNSDVNGDGSVDISDIVAVINIIAGR